MLPNVAIISRPAGPAPRRPSTRRRSRRPDRREGRAGRRGPPPGPPPLIAEVVARRSRVNDRGLRGDASALLFRRAKRRATRLSLVFHRAIEALWEAGGFDEALAIFREHKSELARRASRVRPARAEPIPPGSIDPTMAARRRRDRRSPRRRRGDPSSTSTAC